MVKMNNILVCQSQAILSPNSDLNTLLK